VFETRPHALLIDRDETSRARLAGALRECGFVAAAFRDSRGALAALAGFPAELAVIAAYQAGGGDALAAARQLRHCRPASRILFAGAAATLPCAIERDGGGAALTQPFDKRRFVGAVLDMVSGDADATACREAAELGLVEAELACLDRRRQAGQEDEAAVAAQFRDALAAREALRRALAPPSLD